jgi:hypothetical protein
MEDRPDLRASDADRQQVVERLRGALDEGRLVSATTAHLIYPWPLWVAGPWAAVLFGLSAGATQIRRGRRA